MHAILRDCAGYLWLVLGVFWFVGALTAKRTERSQSPVSLLLQITPVTAAFSLLFGRHAWSGWLQRRLVSQDFLAAAWFGLALTAVGIAFAL